MTTCPTFETSGDDRITPLCDRTMARCPGCRADDAPLPERAGCRDERDDLPNQPRRGPQPDVDVFVLVATPEIGVFTCARLVRPARAVEEARRLDKHCDATSYSDANRSDVFVLRPYNARFEPRAASP